MGSLKMLEHKITCLHWKLLLINAPINQVINDMPVFVAFKKAFGSVIHPGMKLRLKEFNISGKFYDVINSMYSRT